MLREFLCFLKFFKISKESIFLFSANFHSSKSWTVTMCDEEVAALVVDNGSGMCKVRIFEKKTNFGVKWVKFWFELENIEKIENLSQPKKFKNKQFSAKFLKVFKFAFTPRFSSFHSKFELSFCRKTCFKPAPLKLETIEKSQGSYKPNFLIIKWFQEFLSCDAAAENFWSVYTKPMLCGGAFFGDFAKIVISWNWWCACSRAGEMRKDLGSGRLGCKNRSRAVHSLFCQRWYSSCIHTVNKQQEKKKKALSFSRLNTKLCACSLVRSISPPRLRKPLSRKRHILKIGAREHSSTLKN